MPRNANIVSSNVDYEVKRDEQGSRIMKTRNVLYGNRDNEKAEVRMDSSNAPLSYYCQTTILLSHFSWFQNRKS